MRDCSLNYNFSTCCLHQIVFCFGIQNNLVYTKYILIELIVFLYWTRNSTNNLSSYFGLIDARMGASDKDLPVLLAVQMDMFMNLLNWIELISLQNLFICVFGFSMLKLLLFYFRIFNIFCQLSCWGNRGCHRWFSVTRFDYNGA